MLKDTDNVCNMCGASVGGGAAAPPPMAPAPPPPVVSSGAYAPPGPPGMQGMQGYPAAPAMARPAPVGPPPVSQYGAVAPPPPVNAYGQQPPPPPQVGPMAGYGQPAQPGAEMPFTPSPWARAAAPAPQPQPAPQPPQAPAAPGGLQVAPPSPIAMIPGAPAPVTAGGYGAVPAPVTGGYGQPTSPITSNPYGNQQQPAISFGQPPGGPAPPPMIPGAVARPAGIAPPPIVAPPMMSPGALGGAPGMVSNAAGANVPKVLVGFLVTFQNDPSGSFWPIHSGRTALGRSAGEGIDIALQDASASSRHASIHADPATGQAFVEDDGSRNGSFLNEARLTSGERRQLRDNDRLRLGSTTFVVKLLVS
jgi:hypothetical protein